MSSGNFNNMLQANSHLPFVATEAQQAELDYLDRIGSYEIRAEGAYRLYRTVAMCRNVATRQVLPVCVKCRLVCNTLLYLCQHQVECMGLAEAMHSPPFLV